MIKTGNYNKVKFEMWPLGCGQYTIKAWYYGRYLKIHSTNSLAYDDLDSDNKSKRKEACRSIYYEISKMKENIIGEMYSNKKK